MILSEVVAQLEAGDKNFIGKSLVGLPLHDLDLTGCDFTGADLTGVGLGYTNCTNCDFTDATITPCYMFKTILTGVIFSNTKVYDDIIENKAPKQFGELERHQFTIFSQHVLVGCEIRSHDDVRNYTDAQVLAMETDEQKKPEAVSYWYGIKGDLLAAMEEHNE